MRQFVVGALKRLILSLLSTVLAVSFCAFLLTIHSATRRAEPTGFGVMWLYAMVVIVSFGYWAWIVAVPAIVFLTNLRGWRFWTLLLLGTVIGPLTLYFEMISPWLGGHAPDSSDWIEFVLSAGVSFTAALIYLLFLRCSQGGVGARGRFQALFSGPAKDLH